MTDKLREKLINAGRVLVDEGQGDYVWGHISARLPDEPNRFLMKPGCIGVEEMTQDNIITVDIEGEKVAGAWPRSRRSRPIATHTTIAAAAATSPTIGKARLLVTVGPPRGASAAALNSATTQDMPDPLPAVLLGR